ncbi:transglutaminase family protein [Nocardioides sp. LS1]|uniref:transglutaminase family protein n=1 Tax=Nocardioides sp. LS1 TaxID=1027620 RepID=UPI000F617F6E|nr:transglutaminase family protein [Nocardioides sp. LS1]GCD90401.1 hypothetical protein NLS1_24070 [Nocardioides sp. LS1]
MRYRVSHATTYTYDEPVTDSLGIAHLLPRVLPWQEVGEARVEVAPVPGDMSWDRDYYGNTATYFQVTEAHTVLEVHATSEVEVSSPSYDAGLLARPWTALRPLLHPATPGAVAATDFALASGQAPHHPEAAAYAAASFSDGRPVGEAVTDLVRRIHADFAYDKTATTVTSTIEEILEKRAGVCQDFAHLTLACVRSLGMAARYVSGYLATTPPPGQERLVGADASHAWVAVWVGDDEWLALDPTNDSRADDRYVTVAWGRDYADVVPVKGVIFTEAKRSTLQVAVDVAPY